VTKRRGRVSRSTSETSVFDLQSWSTAIATAWILTRNRRFTEACTRSKFPSDHVIDGEADIWKRAGARAGDQSGQKPVMLFPSVAAAWQKLKDTLGEGPDFARAAVLKDFPDLDATAGEGVLASVWRGDDPRQQSRISLSHAAWWIASDRGARPVALDDVATWRPAFEFIVEQIVKGTLTVVAVDPPPARLIPPGEFDGMPLEYPCAAFEINFRSPYRPSRDAHIACTIDPERRTIGDQYFEKGNPIAKWSQLMVQSAELLKLRTTTPRKNLTAKVYSDHVQDVLDRLGRKPTRKEDGNWAQHEGYSREQMRAERNPSSRRKS
jgi:hypothetical protein